MKTMHFLCIFIFVCFKCLHAFECNIAGTPITKPSGVLESPDPGASNQVCIWEFTVPEGQFLRINFTKFELRRQQLCVNSFVEITTLEGEIRYCGGERPPVLTFPGPVEFMLYTRLGRLGGISVPGFVAHFWTESDYQPCSSGQSPCKNSRCYENSQKCDGVDNCGDGSDEEECGHKRVEPVVCGRPAISPEFENYYIVGGREAVAHSWPWQTSLQMRDVFPSGHFCGGALIDNLWVLTAAHCFETRMASEVRVRLGNHDTFNNTEGELVRYIEKVISHPQYDDVAIENDIALLKLTAPVSFSQTISPVCLPKEKETLPVGTMMHATGWGDGKFAEHMEVLRQAKVPIMDWDRCNKLYYGEVTKNTLCTGYEQGGHSPCTGDSGGPLVSQNTDTWAQYGIVSWSHEDCANRVWPSVYTEVAQYVSWIKDVIEKN